MSVADQLQRTGHDVWVYAGEDGDFLSDRLRNAGIRVALGSGALPNDVDVFLVQDTPSSLELLESHPEVPQIYIWHSNVFDVQLPPQLPNVVRLIVTLYDLAFTRINAMAVKPPVIRLMQPIDLERFKPRSPLARAPARAVAIGNYLTGERREILCEACKRAGIELTLYGLREGNQTEQPEDIINSADIVFGKARLVMEAMACGRAAYVYDSFGTDGWVTPENFEQFVANGITGSSTNHVATVDALVTDMADYDRSMGEVNRDLAVANFSSGIHVAGLVAAIERVLGEDLSPPINDGAFELSRLVRSSWRHEGMAFGLGTRLQEVGSELHLLRNQHDLLTVECDQLRQQIEKQANAEAKLAAIVGSRRWRLLNRLITPLDGIRGRRRDGKRQDNSLVEIDDLTLGETHEA